MTGRALFLVTFILLGLVHAWGVSSEGMGIDFYQFWSVGQAVREHLVEDVYAPPAWPRLARIFLERAERDGERRQVAAAKFRKDEIQTSNTPFLYTVFHIFESGNYETDFRRFRLLGLIVTLLSIGALCRRAGYGIAGTLVVVAFTLWAFSPLHDDLREGNVNAIQMGVMSLYLLVAGGGEAIGRRLAAGAILGLGVAFKPNLAFVPLVLVAAWVIRGEWRALAHRVAGMAAGGLLAVGISAAFFGSASPWLAWLSTLRHIQETFGSEMRWGSFGGARLLFDLTGRNLSPVLYLVAIGAIGFAAGIARAGAAASPAAAARDFAIVGIGPLVPILAADLAWPHYLVQAIPLAVWLGRPRSMSRPAAWLFAAALAAVCASPFLDLVAAGNDYAYAITLASGALLLFVLGCVDIARGGEERLAEARGIQ